MLLCAAPVCAADLDDRFAAISSMSATIGADGGDGAMSAYSLDGDAMQATGTGTFLRLTGNTSEPQVAEGAAPVPATIS